jgi:hypothetical protein
MNRIAVLIRQPSLAVEQRAIHVDANQSNHAQLCGLQQILRAITVRLGADTTRAGRVG